ncbi:DKNYY domain-containing protein [Lonsdalea quercina]|uniref:DKNYY domain-containing protein n=1 Tax=Lonsdalea quercina TaxID=71657 RepID=UPI003976979E
MKLSACVKKASAVVFTFFITQQCMAMGKDDVKYPYKLIGDRVVFQPFANVAPEVLSDVDLDSFKVIYRNHGNTNIASSGGNYYCNALKLPQDFNPDTARVFDGSFLFVNNKAYADCALLDFNVNGEDFTALDFPFFTDRKVVFTISGSKIEGVDVKTFKTLSTHQAKDKNNYYFVARNDVFLPYKHNASAYSPCYGWANIDGELYYEGLKYPDADVSTFKCFSFTMSADKHGFYVYDKRQTVIPADTAVKNINPVSENVFSDGKYVWFVAVDAELIKDVNPQKMRVEQDRGEVRISDGVNKWACILMKDKYDSSCHKV